MKVLLYILFSVICWGSLFFDTQYINDSPIVPRKLWVEVGICVFVLFYASFAFLKRKNNAYRLDAKVMYIILLIFAFEQALYGILQYFEIGNTSSFFRVEGDFDNPAGLSVSLCCCLPFCYPFFSSPNRLKRYLAYLFFGVLIIAILMTQSRAGILSMLAICVCMARDRFRIKSAWVLIVSSAVIGLSYLCKKDSANGRLLIWRCSIEMVKEHPVVGLGANAFRANYMNYQASFLKNNPNHPFANLADNVKHPFNEYLNVILMGGFLGLMLLLTFFFFIAYCYYRSRTSITTKAALWSLIGICIFAFFSYPSRYPFIWIVFMLDCIIVIGRADLLMRLSRIAKTTSLVCIILSAGYFLFRSLSKVSAERKWKEIADKAIITKSQRVFCEYDSLQLCFKSNPYFLYNYAAELFLAERYDACLPVLLRCKKMLANYELEMLLGETYSAIGQPSNAIRHYENASYMCPSRIEPMYRIFLIEKESNSSEKAVDTARKILSKETKIPSMEASKMRMELKRYILIHESQKNESLINSTKPMENE